MALFKEPPYGLEDLSIHMGIALQRDSVPVVVCPTPYLGIEFPYHDPEVVPPAALDHVPDFGEERFHVLLRRGDPEFAVGVFPEVLAKEVESFAYVSDVSLFP